MSDRPHILVVDDDKRLRQLLQKYLSENGFMVDTAADAAEARHHLAAIAYDLIVLDVMMPGESGLMLTKSLQGEKSVPILLLTAMGTPQDRIKGLESGADDYLAKPFEPRELVLRINSILRRAVQPAKTRPRLTRFGRFTFDPERNELLDDGLPIHLTAAESALLAILAANPGSTFSRDDLAARSVSIGNLRSVDVQVTRLRRKIEDDPRQPRHLQTVRGLGYVLWAE